MPPSIPEQFDANLLRARELTAGLTHEQFNRRPDPQHWSVAEHLNHLITANRLDLEPVQGAITEARSRGLTGSPPWRYGWLSRKFISSIEPPVRTRFKAPSAYLPPSTPASPERTLSEYERISHALTQLYNAAAGLDLARINVPLPAAPSLLKPFLRMPLEARYQLLAAHDRRHLWHIEQIRSMK